MATAAIGVAAMTSGAARADVSSFPSSARGISLGLAFDYRVSELNALAGKVSYVFGGYGVQSIRPAEPSVHVDAYQPFELDPYPQSFPGHSLADWKATHPDWIVYQCDGRTPAYFGGGSNTEVPLDFSNPAVRQWQEQQAAKLLASNAVQGISFDDFSFGNWYDRCGVYKNGVWTSLGYVNNADNAKYQSDMMTWLIDMRDQLHREFPSKAITVNFPASSGLANTRAIAPYVDAVFDEGGFTDYGDKNLSGSAWQQEVESLEYLGAQGKAFMVNGSVDASSNRGVTHAQLNWVLANYLLVKGAHSYTYVYAANGQGYTGSPSGYGSFTNRAEYHIPIGAPTSARYPAQGVQMRNYSGGLAIVNPSPSRTFTVTLPKGYRDMWGQGRSTVTLAPAAAVVLLAGRGAASMASAARARRAGTARKAARVRRAQMAAVRRRAAGLLSARSAIRFRRRNDFRIACVRIAGGARCTASWKARGHLYSGTVTKVSRGKRRVVWRVRIARKR